MANTARKAAQWLALGAACLALPAVAVADGLDATHAPGWRLRSTSEAIVALIDQANHGSATFRQLIKAIDASDGIVYVEEGACPDDAHACLVGLTVAGLNRALWVHVNLRLHDGDWDAIGSIAHELRHTLEILAVKFVRSTKAMMLFYRSAGYRGSARGYETQAAVDAGNAVRGEIRASTRAARSQ